MILFSESLELITQRLPFALGAVPTKNTSDNCLASAEPAAIFVLAFLQSSFCDLSIVIVEKICYFNH